MPIKAVWVEKHRPKTVDAVIVKDERTRKIFSQYVAEKSIPNILMFGGPGTGKTSMSLALLRDIGVNKLDIIKINCSDEKIEAIREKVKGFATTMPYGDFKVVRLEEFDYLGHDAQALLRALMEEVSDTCRFIATCNYINKITPPLRSRFQEFQVAAPDRHDVLILAATILEAENIDFDITDLEKVVAAAYPDVRKMIQLLEGSVVDGKLNITSAEAVKDWKLDLLPALEASDLKAARKIVCESASAQELADIYTFLARNISRVKKFKNRTDEAIVLLNQYQVQHGQVGDVELNVAALFIELDQLTR